MKIALIYPRFDYPNAGGVQEPLGILYLASALRLDGHEVVVADLSFFDALPNLEKELEGVGMVGISSTSALFGRAIQALRHIREALPDAPVAIGGPHPTALPEETLMEGFDFVVVGEGELSIRGLARAVETGQLIEKAPGIAFMRNGKFHQNEPAPFIEDLDSLPHPDRALIDYERYFKAGLKHAGVAAMRGCPYKCSYCKPMQDKLFGRRIRRRSALDVAREVDSVARSIVDRALFRDDAFTTYGPEWFRELKKGFEELKTPLWGWVCQGRVDQVTPELLDAMSDAGCRMIAFGVESGSQRVLDYYRKGITPAQTERAFAMCRQRGIATHAFIMIGAPIETMEDIEATARLLERIRPNSVSPSIATPAPGTALYEIALKEGIYNIRDWADSDYMSNQRPLRLDNLSVEQILEAREQLSRKGVGFGE